ncbi:MAG TPA: dUTP diphosphatase [Elusimicrobia bacterium]|nr:dUTP diphosphatase [Elusimicrobiota bacterium]
MTARTLKVARLAVGAKVPTRAHPGDAGLDLYSLDGFALRPGEGRVARTGVAVAVPRGHVGLVADRSSMARAGLKTAGGVIDAGYRGEIGVVLWNLSRKRLRVAAGDRLAQLLIVPIATPAVEERPTLTKTSRGAKGFGSSGR